MKISPLNAIAPIDGRYREKTRPLSPYFSEAGLIKYRVLVEVEYFIALCELPLLELKSFPSAGFDDLRQLYNNFDENNAMKVKVLEKNTNHDVKAVEYYLKEYFREKGWAEHSEFIHFGLTSQDINNTAFPLALRDAMKNEYLPLFRDSIIQPLLEKASAWKDISILARTHGQPASPTTLGKEIRVFYERLTEQLRELERLTIQAKFGGATGNFNAHYAAYPDIDWMGFADDFVQNKLGLHRQAWTTQIENYDFLGAYFDCLKRINTILIDLCRDLWSYISFNYFKQLIQSGETGSSTMPHKVNPIDFENAEGNLGVANALFEHLSAKLPLSRLQRDLTDSTVIRNTGLPIAHSYLALKSIQKGISKITPDKASIDCDLDEHWAVISEAIQTVLRKEGYPRPYETLKKLTRTGEAVTKEKLHEFINGLDIKEKLKDRLKKLTPRNYTGKNPW